MSAEEDDEADHNEVMYALERRGWRLDQYANATLWQRIKYLFGNIDWTY